MATSNCLDEVGKELIWIASLAWEKYLSIRGNYEEQDELLKEGDHLVKEKCKEIFHNSRIEFLNFRKSDELFE